MIFSIFYKINTKINVKVSKTKVNTLLKGLLQYFILKYLHIKARFEFNVMDVFSSLNKLIFKIILLLTFLILQYDERDKIHIY